MRNKLTLIKFYCVDFVFVWSEVFFVCWTKRERGGLLKMAELENKKDGKTETAASLEEAATVEQVQETSASAKSQPQLEENQDPLEQGHGETEGEKESGAAAAVLEEVVKETGENENLIFVKHFIQPN